MRRGGSDRGWRGGSDGVCNEGVARVWWGDGDGGWGVCPRHTPIRILCFSVSLFDTHPFVVIRAPARVVQFDLPPICGDLDDSDTVPNLGRVGSTTLGLPPLGLPPLGLPPLGVTPLGVTPLGLTPLGLTPLGLTPLNLTPLGLTPLGVADNRRVPWAERDEGGGQLLARA